MPSRRPVDNTEILDQFLQQADDSATVHELEQRLELHVADTDAYIPSYTRQVMNQNHGMPVMAVHTRTVKENGRVYVYAAKDPNAKSARKFRASESLGGAYFAFGVPLRALKLKLPKGRRYILPLNILEVAGHGIVYWASFADLEHELRNLGTQSAAGSQSKPGPTTDKKA